MKKLIGRTLLGAGIAALALLWVESGHARPVPKSKSEQKAAPQTFFRQANTFSNMLFYFTNRGVLFNNDQLAGLYWPRGSANAYIYGGGVWFATKKELGGRKRKLCELGYNPNSGAGWYREGEIGSNDATPANEKFISYMSPRYDKTNGQYDGVPRATAPGKAAWPLWDTSKTRTVNRNFYFGDYISDVKSRNILDLENATGKRPAPAMLSQEDIVSFYTDQDIAGNPEYKPGTGYPFGLNFQEAIYSWSFGRYRDMIFVRHKVTNASKDVLTECFLAPAFDPDLGPSGANGAGNDRNTYVPDNDSAMVRAALKVDQNPKYEKFAAKPSLLNMAYQSSETEGGKEYGMIGFAFLESPVVDDAGNIIENSDSAGLGGYGPGSKYATNQLGLYTFRKWTIAVDPPTQDLRYDFLASGIKDLNQGIQGDVRLLFSTGPFTLPPGKSVETTVGIGIARADERDRAANRDSLFRLMAFAHEVFGASLPTEYQIDDSTKGYVINHFLAPVPPDIPNLTALSLDRGVLLTWDSTSDRSRDELSNTLDFLGYALYRSTRRDLDSTIRPDGRSPVLKLGEWALYDFKRVEDTNAFGKVVGFHNERLSNVPNQVPHTFLDFGDDNNDGVISDQEGLINGVTYYYYLIAFDEYDSTNRIGPLFTAIVDKRNLASAIPAKPPFPDVPLTLTSTAACPAKAGLVGITLDVVDTAKFYALFTNDTICVSLTPRWKYGNQTTLSSTPMHLYVDVTSHRQDIDLSYDRLFNPDNSTTPYNFNTEVTYSRPGMKGVDTVITGRFSSQQDQFRPNQLVEQTFRVLVDYSLTKLKDPYRLASITVTPPEKSPIVRASKRNQETGAREDQPGGPSYQGGLGEATYEVRFGQPTAMSETELDLVTRGEVTLTQLKDENTQTVFTPQVLPLTVVSLTHSGGDCGEAVLQPIRDHRENDVVKEMDYRFYVDTIMQDENSFPKFSDPDTMKIPVPGKFSLEAWHFAMDNTSSDPTSASQISLMLQTDTALVDRTIGSSYYPYSANNDRDAKHLLTVHRLKVAGGEFVLNFPGLSAESFAGDPVSSSTTFPPRDYEDFKSGDKITLAFTGLMKNVPFAGQCFEIFTTNKEVVNFADATKYTGAVLEQVQVVPNPYVVTHSGQSSTDNAKLYFTRLPPKATIEIYSLAGDLIKTLEHNGYVSGKEGQELANRASVEEWNLLSEGRQRVGSQVLIARVIARDERGVALGETTTKFAVVLGGYRIVR